MPTNQWNLDTVFDVLSDGRARQILVATSGTPRSATALSELVDGSLSSLYRRIDVLTEYGFLVEEIRIDPDGHHYAVYVVNCEEIDITIDDEGISIEFDGSIYEESPLTETGPTE